jgi:polar amino acid transport system substrate-binding protein
VKSWLLWLMLLLMVPVSSFAAPLHALLIGEYRPLKATEAEPVTDGFEASWLARLGELLGSDIALVDPGARADLKVGATASGAVYYASELAGLTAADTGPAKWAELAGRPFCVAAGSPHAKVVASRFGAHARAFPSTAQALIGLKLGECQAVVADRLLLQQIAALPEWRRYNRLLPGLEKAVLPLRVEADDVTLQQRIEQAVSSNRGRQMLADVTQHWVDEVAFQAYVLADTLDCH